MSSSQCPPSCGWPSPRTWRTFDEAAAHYRDELPAAGWDVVRDEDARLKARRDDLVFVLAKDRWGSGMVAIAIKPATPVALPEDP